MGSASEAAPESTERADSDQRWHGSSLALNSAALIAVASAALYLVGHIHQVSYYGRLGLGGVYESVDVPRTMMASVAPLVPVAVWTALIAWILRYLPPLDQPPGLRGWFSPLTPGSVLAVVSVVWMFNVFAEMLYPGPQPQVFGIYDQRDVVSVGVGAGILGLLYATYWMGNDVPDTGRLTRRTWVGAIVLASLTGLSIYNDASANGWPIPWRGWVLIALVLVWIALQVWSDLRTLPKRTENPEPPSSSQFLRLGKGMSVLAWLLVAMMVPLGASFNGMALAEQELEGCATVTGISFQPPPDGFEVDSIHWLVLYTEGTYYVREPPGGNATIYAIPENPGRVAVMTSIASTVRC